MSNDRPGEPLSQKDKIDILLEEYRSLRAESVQSASRYNYIIVGGAAAEAWAFSASGATGTLLWIFAGAIAMLALFLVDSVGRSVWNLSKRIQRIEAEINARAGSHLLVWEQLYGGARRSSVWTSLFPLKPSSHSELDMEANSVPPDGVW